MSPGSAVTRLVLWISILQEAVPSEENLQKDLLDQSTEKTEVKKSTKSQVEVN